MVDQKLVFVLGMHRSGTSVLARMAQIFGASPGRNIMSPHPHQNPKGFFEDNSIVKLNDALLASMNATWQSLNFHPFGESMPQLDSIPEPMRQFIPEAQELLHSLLEEYHFVAIKDPRMCRLLLFWNTVAISIEVMPESVVILRQRGAVAKSLKRRDGMEFNDAIALRQEHNDGIMRYGINVTAVFWYEEILAVPTLAVDKLATALGGLQGRVGAVDEFLDFVDVELNHG